MRRKCHSDLTPLISPGKPRLDSERSSYLANENSRPEGRLSQETSRPSGLEGELDAKVKARQVVVAHERLVLVVGPKAALSDSVQQDWQFALQADMAVTPIPRLGITRSCPPALF